MLSPRLSIGPPPLGSARAHFSPQTSDLLYFSCPQPPTFHHKLPLAFPVLIREQLPNRHFAWPPRTALIRLRRDSGSGYAFLRWAPVLPRWHRIPSLPEPLCRGESDSASLLSLRSPPALSLLYGDV